MNPQPTFLPIDPRPAGVTAEPPRTTAPSRTKRWLAGATLVTVGLVAGGGAVYTLTSTPNDADPGVRSGFGTSPAAGPLGTLPDSARPGEGTSQDQSDGSTDGEAT